MNNLIQSTEIFEDEDREFTKDEFDEQELSFDDFASSIFNLCENVTYYIECPIANFDMIAIKEDEIITVSLDEHIYTKYWKSTIPAENYIKLKETFFNNSNNGFTSETDFEDYCHIFFKTDFSCTPKEFTSMFNKFIKTNERFNANMENLAEDIENTILSFSLKY